MTNRQQTAQLGVAAPILRQQQQRRPISDRYLRANEEAHSQGARLHVRPHDAVHAVTIGERQAPQAEPMGFFDRRLEDWPVMPVASCGFALRPLGFFDQRVRCAGPL